MRIDTCVIGVREDPVTPRRKLRDSRDGCGRRGGRATGPRRTRPGERLGWGETPGWVELGPARMSLIGCKPPRPASSASKRPPSQRSDTTPTTRGQLRSSDRRAAKWVSGIEDAASQRRTGAPPRTQRSSRLIPYLLGHTLRLLLSTMKRLLLLLASLQGKPSIPNSFTSLEPPPHGLSGRIIQKGWIFKLPK